MNIIMYFSMLTLVLSDPTSGAISENKAKTTGGLTISAGYSQVRSLNDQVVLNATQILGLQGLWRVESGPSTSLSQFSDPSNPRSFFEPEAGPGRYVLEWCVGDGVTILDCAETAVEIFSPEIAPRMVGEISSIPTPNADMQGEMYSTTSIGDRVLLFKVKPPFAFSTPIHTAIDIEILGERDEAFLFLAIEEDDSGPKLWRLDAGTDELTRIEASSGPSPVFIWSGLEHQGVYYFVGGTGPTPTLWRTDGTSQGTYPLTLPDLSVHPGEFEVVNDIIYFTASDISHGIEIWRSDGTTEGTFILKDIIPGIFGSRCQNLTAVGDDLYFRADDPKTGIELWKSDGTENGTQPVTDLDIADSPFEHMEALDGKLFFSFKDAGLDERQLWVTDGSPEGTVRVTDLDICGSQSFKYNDHVYFQGGLEPFCQLYRTDGTAATLVVSVPISGTGVVHNGICYFDTLGDGFWRTDGTPEGSWSIPSIPYGLDMYSHGGYLYYRSSPLEPVSNLSMKGLTRINPDARSGKILAPSVACRDRVLLVNASSLPEDTQITWLVANGRIVEGQGAEAVTIDTEAVGTLFLSLLVESPSHASYYVEAEIEVVDLELANWGSSLSGPEDLNSNRCFDILDLVLLGDLCD